MSANLVVDLGSTTVSYPSITSSSGSVAVLSGNALTFANGSQVGNGVDLLHANTFCNLNVVGQPGAGFLSGQLRIGVQCADSDTSGSYTDPTSGLAQFPTWFSSGGIVWINSGGVLNGTIPGAVSQGAGSNPGASQGVVLAASGSPQSGYAILSGFNVYAAFQRTGRYARAFCVSGDTYFGTLQVNFVSQLRTTGSGGGFSYSPSSGQVNV